jgi:hypothetical protein
MKMRDRPRPAGDLRMKISSFHFGAAAPIYRRKREIGPVVDTTCVLGMVPAFPKLSCP